MMSDNLNGRCSVFVAFGGGREGLFFFVWIHCILLCCLPFSFVFCLFGCLLLFSRTWFMVYGGGREEGPKTAKPHKKKIKNRNTALKFTEIPKPQAALVKTYSPSNH